MKNNQINQYLHISVLIDEKSDLRVYDNVGIANVLR